MLSERPRYSEVDGEVRVNTSGFTSALLTSSSYRLSRVYRCPDDDEILLVIPESEPESAEMNVAHCSRGHPVIVPD